MKSEFKLKKVKISEIGAEFGDAPFGTSLKSKDYVENGIPVIQCKNVNNNRFEWNNKIYVPKEKFNSLKRSHCNKGDLAFCKIGSNIGTLAIIPEIEGHDKFLLSTNMMKMSVNEDLADIIYLFYYFSQDKIVYYIKGISGGSSQPIFNFTTLKGFELELPPIEIQKRIGNILSSLDNKIELNNQMNQTLEKIGQAIFRHWFIHFEFPDSEGRPYKSSGGEMVDSELGEIPKGWKVGNISDLCDSITNGGTPKRKEPTYWENGTIPWFKTGELFDSPLIDSEEHITQKGLDKSSCKLWGPNTILIALYASPTVGRLGILKKAATSNQACSGLIAKKDIGHQYLFYNLLFKREELNSIAVGSAQQNISQDIIRNTKTIIPSFDITLEFQELVEPFFEQKTLLIEENNNLSKLRDSLLPKLMSGKIRVNVPEEATVK